MALARAAESCLSKGSFLEAAQLFREHIEKTECSQIERLSYLLNIGTCLIAASQYSEGQKTLESVIDGTESLPDQEYDPKMAAEAHYNLAMVAYKLGRRSVACDHLNQSIPLYLKAGRTDQAGDVYMELAVHHSDQLDKHITALKCAQELYSASGARGKEASTTLELASAHLAAGNMEECQCMMDTARILTRSITRKSVKAQLLLHIGRLHTTLAMLQEALHCFLDALPLVRESGNGVKVEGALLQNIGAVLNELKRFEESIPYHTGAAAINRRNKLYTDEVKCICNLGFAQAQLQDFTSSISTFTVCLSKAEQLNDAGYLLVQCLEGLGSGHYHMKQYDQSQASFEKALEVLSTCEDTGLAKERVMEKLSDLIELQSKGMTSADNETMCNDSSYLEEMTHYLTTCSKTSDDDSSSAIIANGSTTANSTAVVREGCLALGPLAKDQYRVEAGTIQEINPSIEAQHPTIPTNNNSSSSICIIL